VRLVDDCINLSSTKANCKSMAFGMEVARHAVGLHHLLIGRLLHNNFDLRSALSLLPIVRIFLTD